MEVLYPTDKVKLVESVFLAGSIEQNLATRWQDYVIKSLKDDDIKIYNPRRSDYNTELEQNIHNKDFKHQVLWEDAMLNKADLILLYFDPNTKSMISLLEFGKYMNKMIVCCSEGYCRKGNVDIICEKYNIPQVSTIDELIIYVKEKIKLDI